MWFFLGWLCFCNNHPGWGALFFWIGIEDKK